RCVGDPRPGTGSVTVALRPGLGVGLELLLERSQLGEGRVRIRFALALVLAALPLDERGAQLRIAVGATLIALAPALITAPSPLGAPLSRRPACGPVPLGATPLGTAALCLEALARRPVMAPFGSGPFCGGLRRRRNLVGRSGRRRLAIGRRGL